MKISASPLHEKSRWKGCLWLGASVAVAIVLTVVGLIVACGIAGRRLLELILTLVSAGRYRK